MNVIAVVRHRKFRSILAESWAQSWPMVLIMFYEFLVGLADVFIAGKFGTEVQAAYGLAFQLYFLFLIIGFALNVGTVSVVSRLFTSPSRDELSGAITTSLHTAFITGAACTLIGAVSAGQIISVLDAPAVIKPLVTSLLRIYALGFVFDYLLMNTHAVLRAGQRIRRSLISATVVCVMNIVLNMTLAFRTPLGCNGIAVATVISLLCGSILNLWFCRGLIRQWRVFSVAILKKIWNIGWPSVILHILWQSGAMVLFLVLSRIPAHNVEIMAAFTGGLKIESAVFLPVFAFNMANAVVVGNLLGKKEDRDAFYGGIITALSGVVLVICLVAAVFLNARTIAGMLSADERVVREMLRYIFVALLFEPVMAWGVILSGGLNGAGDTRTVMRIVGMSVWCVRIPLSYLLGIICGWGPLAIWWVMNFSVTVQAVLVSRRYFSRRWIEYAHTTM